MNYFLIKNFENRPFLRNLYRDCLSETFFLPNAHPKNLVIPATAQMENI